MATRRTGLKKFEWRTSFVMVRTFMRWALIIAILSALGGIYIAKKTVDSKAESLTGQVTSRLEIQVASRTDLIRLWALTLMDSGSNMISSDLVRLYATEVELAGDVSSEPVLEAQKPYMEYMVTEFARQHSLIGAYFVDSNSRAYLSSGGAPNLSPGQIQAISKVLKSSQPVMLPVSQVGPQLLVDVARPIFALSESDEVYETIGVFLTTHDIRKDIERLLETRELDQPGERFTLLQTTSNEHVEHVTSSSIQRMKGLTQGGLVKKFAKPKRTKSPIEKDKVFAVVNTVGQTPFLVFGEYETDRLVDLVGEARQAIYASTTVIVLVIVVLLLTILWRLVVNYSSQRSRLQEQTMSVLVRAQEIRDPYLAGHHQRMARLAIKVANVMKFSVIERSTLFYAAELSGIGKIFVSKDILTKPGKLTDLERTELEKHVQHASRVLSDVAIDLPIKPVILQMHERVDGSGYPNKIKGKKINKLARVLAVCDVYCALTSPRAYREDMSTKQALGIIDEQIEKYDSKVVAALRQAELPNKK